MEEFFPVFLYFLIFYSIQIYQVTDSSIIKGRAKICAISQGIFGIFGRISKLFFSSSAISRGTSNNILRSPLWVKLFRSAGKWTLPFETQHTVDFVPPYLYSSDFSWRAHDTARRQAPIFYFLMSYGCYIRHRRLLLLYRLS